MLHYFYLSFFYFSFSLIQLSAADNSSAWGFSSWWQQTPQNIPKKDAELSAELSMDDFIEVTSDPDSDQSNNWQKYFLESNDHNPLIAPEIRRRLVDKGYFIIQKIVAHEEIEHSIEIFDNAGRHFVESSYFQDIPTLKSITKGFNKSIAWANSYLGSANAEIDSEVIANQKTLNRRAHLESIIAVMWALSDHAARLKYCQADLFFTVKDEKFVLWQLASSYYDLYKNDGQTLESSFVSIPMYERSNFKQKEIIQALSINTRFESTSWSLPVLPYNNNTIFIAKITADRSSLSPEKTICKLTQTKEGIAAWTYQGQNQEIITHQKMRKEILKTYATIVKDFVIQEGVHVDEKVLTQYDQNTAKALINVMREMASDQENLPIGVFTRIAEYINQSNLYSPEADQAAKDLLLFLKNNCGDKITEDQSSYKIDPLSTYRIEDEVLVDISTLPENEINEIEILSSPALDRAQIIEQSFAIAPAKENLNISQNHEAIMIQNEAQLEDSVDVSDDAVDVSDDAVDVSDDTVDALFQAIENQNVKLVETMIEQNKKLINIHHSSAKSSDLNGRTPLHHAVFKHNIELVKLLINEGADLDPQDKIGRTPLFMAYQFTKKPIIEILIEKGSKVNIVAKSNDSVIQTALRRVDHSMLLYFINHGGSLEINKKQSLRIFNGIIRSAQIQPAKDSLPRDMQIYKDQIKILTLPPVHDFLMKNIGYFVKEYSDFLKDLYQKQKDT